MMRLQVRDLPTVDAFADSELNLVERSWGPGSTEFEDARAAPWENEKLVWANPPFTMLKQFVEKIVASKAKVILICPHWPGRPYLPKALSMAVRKYLYPKGTKMFEERDGALAGTKWPVWALLVDGAYKAEVPPAVYTEEVDDVPKLRTTSSRRSYRRKFKEQGMC